jgi:hypothetical protein
VHAEAELPQVVKVNAGSTNEHPRVFLFNISIEIQALWAWSEFNGYAS